MTARDPAVALWLGSAPPVRSIRWLDGALHAAAKLPGATAVAAGSELWLELATDRAIRAGLPITGVPTDLQLDYLGWAQIVAAVARQLGATTVLVEEASRPERFAEVAAIAELCDAAQLTQVIALAPDAAAVTALRASRVAGDQLQTIRVTGPAVIGLRIAGPPVDEYNTPVPSAALRRLELAALGLDPSVLGHRALPPRATQEPRRSAERVAEYLALYAAPAAPASGAPRSSRPTDHKPAGDRTAADRPAKDRPARTTKTSRGPKGAKGAKGARGARGAGDD